MCNNLPVTSEHVSLGAQTELESDVKLVLSEALTGVVNLLPAWQFNLPVQAEWDLLGSEAQGSL